MAKTDLKTASVLAFERKLDPSDALFSAGKWVDRKNGENWPSIGINTKSVRGTISNRLSTKDQDPAKLDASIQSPNLQTVDVAALPSDADTLRVRFTLRVLGVYQCATGRWPEPVQPSAAGLHCYRTCAPAGSW